MNYYLEAILKEHNSDKTVWIRKAVNFQPTYGLCINSSRMGNSFLSDDELTIVGQFESIWETTDLDKALAHYLNVGWFVYSK